jgi:hydroxyacylglutathione hydrolase
MLFRRIYDDKLAQASYFIGCQATGEALVVDPNRDAAQYLEVAQVEGMRLTHITETHIHADFVSGARELAAKSGARLLLSGEGGASWSYLFAAESGAQLLHDGDEFMVGRLRLQVVHTPGHTPEHLAFILTDTPATDVPMGVFTGDFLFVGDVGRPDLLEKAANVTGSMEESARQLYRSLQNFKRLPDYLQLWPGHGAGSACGKALGAMPASTLGYERVANWGLQAASEHEFVESVLTGQPDPPRYFARMKRVNRAGPPMRVEVRPRELDRDDLQSLIGGGTRLLDYRPAAEFAKRHIRGAINIPQNRQFTTWAGSLVPYDVPLALLGPAERVDEAIRDLSLIGFDQIAGTADSHLVDEWVAAGLPVGEVRRASVDQLRDAIANGDALVMDVRAQDEWDRGHLVGAMHCPLGRLPDEAAKFAGQEIYVHCQGGSRSAIAASLLLANGARSVTNVEDGFSAWEDANLPFVIGPTPTSG